MVALATTLEALRSAGATAVHWPRVAEGGAYRYGSPASAAAEVAVVRAIYDAFARRDVEAAIELVAEDFEVLPTGTARAVGRTEPYRGRAGLREYLADTERAWQELRLEADDIRAVAGS